MLKLGFSSMFVRLVMKCVTSVRLSVRVNGDLLPFFTPTKGLRQGDPVSPYLFLLCAEGFSSLLKYYGGDYIDRGIRVSYRSPWVSHLLFADDSLIFISAKQQSAQRLNEILQIYASASGQCVNREKSAIYFSTNTPQPVRHLLKGSLNIQAETFSERYLGLPTAVGQITSGTFDHIGERARAKIQGWSEKLLACAGREVLLKSVVQAMPTYSMSTFRLTKKTCKSITSPMAHYFWSSSLDKKGMHWVSWNDLASPKCNGGMGFRDLPLFNLALLGKHGWRLMTKPNSLCARVLKGRYFPDTDFLHASVPKSASATWRAIIAGRETLNAGLIKRVGDGSSISVWTDKWIPGTTMMTPLSRPPATIVEYVSDLIDTDNWTWNQQLVRDSFIAPDAAAILNIPLRQGGGEDYYAWAFDPSGNYTVKTAYRSLVTQKERSALEEGTATETSPNEKQMWKALWKLNVVPKV
jgi:hypothetical protein